MDCVNVINSPGRAVPSYHALSSKRKTLVVLTGANHCGFTTPVKGMCSYDICGTLTKTVQQATAIELMSRFGRAIVSNRWDAWEQYLRVGEAASRWQFLTESSSAGKMLNYTACPARCCSAALAAMGLCKNTTDASGH